MKIIKIKRGKGDSINILSLTSFTGLRSFPGVVAYNMSKAALDQLTRTSALEVAAQGVRINSVNPGVIVTDVHKKSGMSEIQLVT